MRHRPSNGRDTATECGVLKRTTTNTQQAGLWPTMSAVDQVFQICWLICTKDAHTNYASALAHKIVHLHTKLCTCIVFVRILTFAHKIWLRFKSRLGCFLNSLIWVPPSPTRANKWWLVCGNQGFIYQLRTVIYQDDCCYLSLLSVAGGALCWKTMYVAKEKSM